LEFILSRRDKLFPEVPIVFCGINDFRAEQLYGQSGITGVNEEIDIKGTIALASRILPNIQKFLVISDRTPTGLANRRKFEETLSGFSNKAPVFELLDDLTVADLQKHLGRLSSDSAVLFFTFQRDKDGRLFPPPEYFKLVVESCNVPVFSFWETDLPYGVMGGVMVSGMTQGERAAEYAVRILKGEPVSSLPFIMKSPNVPILDYQLLRQFNIPKDVIPAEAIILNEPITLYYRYKTTIWLISFFIISLIFVIIVLLINIARRKRAEEALRETTEYLDDLFNYANAPIIVWDPEFRITRFNHAFEKLTGRTSREVIGKSLEILFPPLQVDASMSFIRKTQLCEPWQEVELAIATMDGTERTVLWNSSTLMAPDGKTPIATIAQGNDITARKLAESRLNEQILELQRWHNVTLGRESRILDLKREVNELLGKAGQPPRYPSAESQDEKEK
jgi:two-component system cell cycle sensor histidine kinase/response regulator CckA